MTMRNGIGLHPSTSILSAFNIYLPSFYPSFNLGEAARVQPKNDQAADWSIGLALLSTLMCAENRADIAASIPAASKP